MEESRKGQQLDALICAPGWLRFSDGVSQHQIVDIC